MPKIARGLQRQIAEMEKQKAELDARSERLAGDILALKRAHEILTGVDSVLSEGAVVPPVDVAPPKPFERKQYPMPLGDAVEKVLRECGHKLHISKILDQLGTMGPRPSRHSLTSIIRKDSRKRFTAHGQGEYGLTEWESLRENAEPMRLTG